MRFNFWKFHIIGTKSVFSKWSNVAGIFKALSELNTYLSLLMNIYQTQLLSGIELDFHPIPLDIIVQEVKGKAQIIWYIINLIVYIYMHKQ